MKRFLPYLKTYKLYAYLTPLCMLLEVLADILLPYLMSKIVDVGISNRDITYIFKTGILMVLLALAAMLFGMIGAIFASKAGHGLSANIREETFSNIQEFSFDDLDSFGVSSLVTRLTTDITMIAQTTITCLRIGFRSAFMMIFALVMAMNISRELTLIFFIAVPLSSLIMYFILKKASPLFMKLQVQTDKLNRRMKENLVGIGVVKSFNTETFENKKFSKNNKELRTIALHAITTLVFLNPLLNMVMYATIIAVLWFGGQQVVIGGLQQGQLISYITYITQVLLSLMILSTFFTQLLRGIASKDRILEVWDSKVSMNEKTNAKNQLVHGDIQFQHVSFRYHENSSYVLKDINLNIRSGETVGIIGATGSSKSSLVYLIARFYEVSSGELCISNNKVEDYSLKTLRDEIAFVLQDNVLFTGTIQDNMRWGNDDASDIEIIEALKQACAWDFVSKLDGTLNHKVEEGGNNFSGGQKQRLCIARALLKQPKILILDDSTSALDMTTEAKVQSTLQNKLKGVTKIMISQRIASLQYADRIVVMHEGMISDIGTHTELLIKSSIYREIYESQKKGRCINE